MTPIRGAVYRTHGWRGGFTRRRKQQPGPPPGSGLAQVSCHSSVLNNLVARQEKVRHRTYPGGGLLQKERRVTPDRIRTEPSWSGWCNDPADGESGPLLRHYGVRSPKAAPARKPVPAGVFGPILPASPSSASRRRAAQMPPLCPRRAAMKPPGVRRKPHGPGERPTDAAAAN